MFQAIPLSIDRVLTSNALCQSPLFLYAGTKERKQYQLVFFFLRRMSHNSNLFKVKVLVWPNGFPQFFLFHSISAFSDDLFYLSLSLLHKFSELVLLFSLSAFFLCNSVGKKISEKFS